MNSNKVDLNSPITYSKYLPGFEDICMDRLSKTYCATTHRHSMQSSFNTFSTSEHWDKLLVRVLIFHPMNSAVDRDKIKKDILESLHPWPKGKIVFIADGDPKSKSGYDIITPCSVRHTFEIAIHSASLLEIGISDNLDLFS